MTSLSQYLRAERLDPTEPVSFYVPGVKNWHELKSPRGRAGMLTRSRAPEERVYPVESEDEIEH